MQTSRLSYLKKLLATNSIDAALISSIPNIIYLTDFNYFSDLEREAFLLITKKNNFIITDARYSHAVTTNLKNFTLLEISINNSFTHLLNTIIKKEKIQILGVEENNITVAEYKKISSVIKEINHLDLNAFRIIKTTTEIKKIKKACEIGDKAIEYILKKIKLGVTEKELALQLETFMRNSGAEPSFPTIVAFQENAAVPHHKTSDRKLNKNEFVLIDSGVKYENYCSDMTRTFFFGKANSEQKLVYNTVLETQRKAIELLDHKLVHDPTNKVEGAEIDKMAREYIINQGFQTIPHSLGHGIGLEVHEAPRLSSASKEILTAGMVFSIEPGIYLPAGRQGLSNKFGVRIEDLFTIQGNKLVQLTKSPINLLEI